MAFEAKATKRPSALTEGESLTAGASAGPPSKATETSSTPGAWPRGAGSLPAARAAPRIASQTGSP